MKLNYYQFKTTEARAVKVLVKGLIQLAGESAVVLCSGLVTEGMLYVNLTSPLPLPTIRAVIMAMAASGVNGSALINGSIECHKTTNGPLIQRRTMEPNASQPASGHSRFDPNMMSFPE